MTQPEQAHPGRSIQLNEQMVRYHLRRSQRKTIGLRISAQGLQVTAPNWVALSEVERVLQERTTWILRHLQAWAERQDQLSKTRTRWEGGGTVPYLGIDLQLQLGHTRPLEYQGRLHAPAQGDILRLGLPLQAPEKEVRHAVLTWMQNRARALLEERLRAALIRTGRTISGWRLSSATTRWGSCSSQGRIMLNWRLIHLQPDIIDYVIVHELAHLKEMNHSPAFWAEVAALMPDYQEARERLRRIDPATLPTF